MGGARFPASLTVQVAELAAAGHSHAQIAKDKKIHRNTVRRVLSRHKEFGVEEPPPPVRTGRPPLLQREQEDILLESVNHRPDIFLDELVHQVFEEFDGIEISIASLSRLLRKRGWTRGNARERVNPDYAEKRAEWMTKMAGYRADQLVFIDESAANDRSNFRRFGWTWTISSYFKPSARWSVVPALSTKHGYFASPLIHEGQVTEEIFVKWLRWRVVPRLEEGQILIMDEAPYHRGELINELVKDTGVRIFYLPPHSADFNPNELTFKHMNYWIKRHIDEAYDFKTFGDFLEEAFRDHSERDVIRYYKDCGYRID